MRVQNEVMTTNAKKHPHTKKPADSFTYMSIHDLFHFQVVGFLVCLDDQIIYHLFTRRGRRDRRRKRKGRSKERKKRIRLRQYSMKVE